METCHIIIKITNNIKLWSLFYSCPRSDTICSFGNNYHRNIYTVQNWWRSSNALESKRGAVLKPSKVITQQVPARGTWPRWSVSLSYTVTWWWESTIKVKCQVTEIKRYKTLCLYEQKQSLICQKLQIKIDFQVESSYKPNSSFTVKYCINKITLEIDYNVSYFSSLKSCFCEN